MKKKHNVKYKVKLRFSMILFSLIPCVLSAVLVFVMMSAPRINTLTKDKKFFFERSATKINIVFDNVINQCNTIATDMNVGKIFCKTNSRAPMYDNIRNSEILTTLLSSLRNDENGIVDNVVIYHNNPELFKTRFYQPIENLSENIDIDLLNKNSFVWSRKDDMIYLYRKLDTTSKNINAFILCTISAEKVEKIIDDFSLNSDVSYVYAENSKDVDNMKYLDSYQLRNGDYIILNNLSKYYVRIYAQALGISLVFLIVVMMLILSISSRAAKNLTGEFYGLIDMMQEDVFLDKFDFKISEDSELMPVYRKLKSLIDEINRVNSEKTQIEHSKYAAELQYVQSKINPHLLYNSLSAIKWICEDANPEIAKNIDCLADYYRFTVSLSHIISFETEIELLRKYINLLNLTHSCEYSLFIDLSQSILNVKTIMHIFQPFVENSVLHGIRNMTDGRIDITGHIEDNTLFIKISDNGVGILPERLEEIRKMEYSSKYQSFGIKNTLERLKLFYNDNCRIEIYSEYKKGTDICITIPDYLSINL